MDILSVCAHVTNGGTLPDLCTQLKIPYNKTVTWIYADPERASQYEKALHARNEWFVQNVLAELKSIAFADLRKAYDEHGQLRPPHELPDEVAHAIQVIETEELYAGKGPRIGQTKRIKMCDKLRALELLGKHLSMFKTEIEIHNTLTLEELVLGSMQLEVIQCSPPIKQQIISTTKEIPLVETSKEPDSLSNGKTVLSDAAKTE